MSAEPSADVAAVALAPPRGVSNRARAALAVASGLTLALGAPPLRFWPSTFVSLLLLAMAVDGATVRRAALSGWLMGTFATLGAFYWIIGTVTRFTSLPLAAALALYVLMAMLAGLSLGVACAIAAGTAPVVSWPGGLAIGIVVAERWAPSVFPWQIVAPLIYAPWIRQCADVLGVSGLGALLVALAVFYARALIAWRARDLAARARMPSHAQLAIATTALIVAWGYGAIRTQGVARAMASAPVIQTALVQPVIAYAEVRTQDGDLRRLDQLQAQTRAAIDAGARLVVWSEAAYPFVLPNRASIDGMVAPPIYPDATDASILAGVITGDEAGHLYNAAMLRQSDGTVDAPVAKQVLVPFGEYVPVVGNIAWVRRTFARASGLTPGATPERVRTHDGLRLGVLNCFEDTIPVMGATLADSDLLVNVTNDAWFGRGAAPWQHLMLAQWRAIETRRELVRAVNTGVTCRVDALGRVADAAPLWRQTVLLVPARRMSLAPVAPWLIPRAPIAALVLAAAALALRAARSRRWSR